MRAGEGGSRRSRTAHSPVASGTGGGCASRSEAPQELPRFPFVSTHLFVNAGGTVMNAPVSAAAIVVISAAAAQTITASARCGAKLLLVSVLLFIAAPGCTQTAVQREQCRYWNTVTDRLAFNRGLPRQHIEAETRTTTTTITTKRTASDK